MRAVPAVRERWTYCNIECQTLICRKDEGRASLTCLCLHSGGLARKHCDNVERASGFKSRRCGGWKCKCRHGAPGSPAAVSDVRCESTALSLDCFEKNDQSGTSLSVWAIWPQFKASYWPAEGSLGSKSTEKKLSVLLSSLFASFWIRGLSHARAGCAVKCKMAVLPTDSANNKTTKKNCIPMDCPFNKKTTANANYCS